LVQNRFQREIWKGSAVYPTLKLVQIQNFRSLIITTAALPVLYSWRTCHLDVVGVMESFHEFYLTNRIEFDAIRIPIDSTMKKEMSNID
jgi:hypothetical protein